MIIYMVVFLVIAVIAVQAAVCLKSFRLLVRMLPAMLLALVQVALWCVFLFSDDSPAIALASVVYSAVRVILLIADVLGWVAYWIISKLKARRHEEPEE